MSILICSTTYGGCGHIGDSSEFRSIGEDFVECPACKEDHCFQLIADNLISLTNDENRELGEKLLNNDESVVAIAQCGCVHHAEDRTACPHDIALAREWHDAKNQSSI